MNIFRHTWIQIYRGCLKSFATPSLQSKSKSKYLQFLFLTKEWHHPVSWNKKFKDIPLAGKVMATVLWDAQEVTSVSIMQRDQTTNSNRYSQTFKNCRTISAELDLTKMVLKSSFNMKTHNDTQVWKHRKQSQYSDELFFPTHHTAQFLPPQNYTSLETAKMSSTGKSVGLMTWLLKKLISGCEYRIQTGTRTGWCSFLTGARLLNLMDII